MRPSVPVEFGDDFADCLGGTGGGRDDVLGGSAAVTPGLGAGTVHRLLGGGVGVDRRLRGRVGLHTARAHMEVHGTSKGWTTALHWDSP